MKEIRLPEIMKKLSDEKGTNQSDLARYLGVTRQTVSLYYSGKITPELSTLIKIAEYFDVSLDYLITGERPEHNQVRAELGISEKAIDLLSEIAHYSKDNELGNISNHVNKILSDKDFYSFLKDNEEVNAEKIRECQDLEKINEGGKYNSLIKITLEQTIKESSLHMEKFFHLFYKNLLSSYAPDEP